MEHLREYQDYLLAYRLRALIGGALRPRTAPLELAAYARARLERQELARALLGSGEYRERMRRVDELTDRLNFGFWTNPNETVTVLRRVIEAGGCRAVESEEAFAEELFTRLERERLSVRTQRLIARYYLGLLRASAAYLDPEIFTRLRAEIDPLREELPIFVLPEAGPAVGAGSPAALPEE